ncbi:MAG TPA: hypothetical protein ACHBZ9_05700 [Arsenophonus nasoniae]|uniref:hypothetical protein n=1 Tax=Arsenophonus nasoniae TaxID=638 RepID=UPI003879B063
MAIIADFNFDDKHSLSDYNLINNEDYPLDYKFVGSKLILQNTSPFNTSMLIDLKDNIPEGEKIKVLIKSAKGKATILNNGFEINNESEKNAEGTASVFKVGSDNTSVISIFINSGDDANIEFTGYKIEYDK